MAPAQIRPILAVDFLLGRILGLEGPVPALEDLHLQGDLGQIVVVLSPTTVG